METKADVYRWSPRELEQMSTQELKALVDEDEIKEFINENDPDEMELRDWLIERIS